MVKYGYVFAVIGLFVLTFCKPNNQANQKATTKFLNEPLVSEIYTADPSAHVFENRIYVYPSHDIKSERIPGDCGSQYSMTDYTVFSMDSIGGPVTLHKVALHLKDVPWAKRMLWAPDAATKNGTYYLYFPAKDKEDIFRIGVAVSNRPEGPFTAQPTFIEGSYSIDPAVFEDEDGSFYMYFGGIWGGQIQHWENNKYTPADCDKKDNERSNAPAIGPRIVKLSEDMLGFSEDVKEIQIVDSDGSPILTKENHKRFFEAAWMHKRNGKYYLSYSTGDTHCIVYAMSDNPYGPFTYKGILNHPVKGWTNHHSVVEVKGKWYLFYHDIQLSNQTNLRNVKVAEIFYNNDGTMKALNTLIE